MSELVLAQCKLFCYSHISVVGLPVCHIISIPFSSLFHCVVVCCFALFVCLLPFVYVDRIFCLFILLACLLFGWLVAVCLRQSYF